MIRKVAKLSFLFLFLIPSLSKAQYNLEQRIAIGDSAQQQFFFADFYFIGNSSSMPNSFLASFIGKDRVLQDDIRTNALGRLNAQNRAGGDFGASLIYRWNSKKLLYHQVTMRNRDVLTAKFSDDFVRLLFLGNKQFEDQTAEFGGMIMNRVNTHEIKYQTGKQMGEKMTLEAGITAIKGGKLQRIEVDRGSLYTAPFGEYLDADVNATFYQSDTGSTRADFVGFGGALNANLNYKLNEKSSLTVGFSDLGAVAWTETQKFSADSSYHIEGLVIDNVLEPTDLTAGGLSSDSLLSVLGVEQDNSGFALPLPASFYAAYTNEFSSTNTLFVGVEYVLSPGYLPLLYAKVIHHWNRGWSFSPNLSAGGLGTFNVGFGFGKAFKKLELNFNTRFMDSLILYESRGGMGAYISAKYRL